MRAVALDYERRRLVERSLREPPLPAGGEVLFRVEQVGICATDRELAAFRFGYPPEGETSLVLGHEALGRVVAAGAGVRDLRPGDLVTAMIRRACPERCPACARGRRDLCLSGRYRERGIFGAHGYFTELAVDAAEDLAAIPPGIAEVGVLAEPLSVVEKAIERACEIRGDRPASALVIGAGPIGMLAALALMARGAAVSLHSLEPRTHPRPGLATAAGARYLESRALRPFHTGSNDPQGRFWRVPEEHPGIAGRSVQNRACNTLTGKGPRSLYELPLPARDLQRDLRKVDFRRHL